MQSLRDKLLKAGLVSEEQAKKAESDKEKPPVAPPSASASEPSRPRPPASAAARPPPPRYKAHEKASGRRFGPSPSKAASVPRLEGERDALAHVPKLPPMPGSKAFQRLESQKQVQINKALLDLVLPAQLPVENGEQTFYFITRKGKLRRLEMTPAFAARLEAGELAVVERPEPAQIEHSVVFAEVAEKMFALSPKSVRFLNRKENPIGFVSEEAKSRGEDQPESAVDAAAAGTEALAASVDTVETRSATAGGEPIPSADSFAQPSSAEVPVSEAKS